MRIILTEGQLRQLTRQILLELRNAGGEGPPSASAYFARPIAGGHVLYYGVSSSGAPKAIPGTLGYYFDTTYVEGSKSLVGSSLNLSPEGLKKAEELVDMGLYNKDEKKVEYPDITFKYRKNTWPGSPASQWKSEEDVPKTHVSYSPKEGTGYEFLLVDTENRLVSLDASWSARRSRRGDGRPGSGSNRDKSYVIPSGDVGFTSDTLALQKLFKHLIAVDPRVTANYSIISPDDKFKGKTIGDAAGEKRIIDVALGATPGKLIAYHGTSTKRWPTIEKAGLRPGKFETAYADQIPGYSESNIYLTVDPHTAENYATRAAVWDKSTALVLKLEVPDITKIVPDEDFIGLIKLSRTYTLTPADDTDEPWVLEGEQHPKNLMRLLQDRSKFKHDTELDALVVEVQQKMASFLTKSLAGESFAYRGSILPRYIRRWKEYPRKAYPKSVSTGEGTGDEYEETRQSVLKRVKQFDETIIRRFTRWALWKNI